MSDLDKRQLNDLKYYVSAVSTDAAYLKSAEDVEVADLEEVHANALALAEFYADLIKLKKGAK